ncbi:hypothetical protein ACRJ4B_21810 [Streptomyces sp. GTA36]
MVPQTVPGTEYAELVEVGALPEASVSEAVARLAVLIAKTATPVPVVGPNDD